MVQYRKSPLWVTLAISAITLVWTGCGKESDPLPASSISSGNSVNTPGSTDSSVPNIKEPTQILAVGPSTEAPARTVVESGPPEVLIETNLGDIRIRLHQEDAPLTVTNFLMNYVDRGFYDNTIFHFVEKDFIISAGGYDQQFKPKDPRTAIANEAHNGLKNLRGTLAMSRDPAHINSANCQFYINLVDNPALDHQSGDDEATYGYCVFGEVIEGLDIVDKIAEVPVEDRENFPNSPKETVLIKSIRRR